MCKTITIALLFTKLIINMKLVISLTVMTKVLPPIHANILTVASINFKHWNIMTRAPWLAECSIRVDKCFM